MYYQQFSFIESNFIAKQNPFFRIYNLATLNLIWAAKVLRFYYLTKKRLNCATTKGFGVVKSRKRYHFGYF